MTLLHVKVEQDEGWFIAHGLEEPGVITQGRTLDGIAANVRGRRVDVQSEERAD